ncbi:MAG: hypothetical protein Q8L85_10430 [Alphaproteobacteria bacterium]|nr:hypothetical protein [Alphaproteobacteria bacterium]
MKKTILTFSILLSLVSFNTFAVDDDNILEIESLSIEQYLTIARDESKPENQRLNACCRLINFPENTIEEILFLALALAIRDFAIHAQDENVKFYALFIFHNVVKSRLLEFVENTNNETVKWEMLGKLWYKDTLCRDLLSPILLDLSQHAKDEKKKFLAFGMLWHFKNKTNFDELITIGLNLIESDLNESTKLTHIIELWDSIRIKDTHRIRLTLLLLDFALYAKDEKDKICAIKMLWNNKEAKAAHRDLLMPMLLGLSQNAKNEKIF